MAGKLKNTGSFTVNYPKRRYEIKTNDVKTSYCVKEVDSQIKIKGVNNYTKDFKVYKELRTFNTMMKRHDTQETLIKEGINNLEEAIKVADGLAL